MFDFVRMDDQFGVWKMPEGMKMCVRMDDWSLTPHLILDGYWEQWVMQHWKKIIKPGMTVVDGGASTGYFSILAASIVGDSGCVYAIDPEPTNIECIHRTVALNGWGQRLRPIHKALLDETRRVKLYSKPHNGCLNNIWKGVEETALDVEGDTLDNVIPADKRVDVIKLDTEGSEFHILKGMERILSRDRPKIVLEFSSMMLREAGSHPPDLLAFLRQKNYQYSLIDWGGDGLKEVTDEWILNYDYSMLYCEPL